MQANPNGNQDPNTDRDQNSQNGAKGTSKATQRAAQRAEKDPDLLDFDNFSQSQTQTQTTAAQSANPSSPVQGQNPNAQSIMPPQAQLTNQQRQQIQPRQTTTQILPYTQSQTQNVRGQQRTDQPLNSQSTTVSQLFVPTSNTRTIYDPVNPWQAQGQSTQLQSTQMQAQQSFQSKASPYVNRVVQERRDLLDIIGGHLGQPTRENLEKIEAPLDFLQEMVSKCISSLHERGQQLQQNAGGLRLGGAGQVQPNQMGQQLQQNAGQSAGYVQPNQLGQQHQQNTGPPAGQVFVISRQQFQQNAGKSAGYVYHNQLGQQPPQNNDGLQFERQPVNGDDLAEQRAEFEKACAEAGQRQGRPLQADQLNDVTQQRNSGDNLLRDIGGMPGNTPMAKATGKTFKVHPSSNNMRGQHGQFRSGSRRSIDSGSGSDEMQQAQNAQLRQEQLNMVHACRVGQVAALKLGASQRGGRFSQRVNFQVTEVTITDARDLRVPLPTSATEPPAPFKLGLWFPCQPGQIRLGSNGGGYMGWQTFKTPIREHGQPLPGRPRTYQERNQCLAQERGACDGWFAIPETAAIGDRPEGTEVVNITAEAAQNFAMSQRLGKRNQDATEFLVRGRGCAVCGDAVMQDASGHVRSNNLHKHGPFIRHGRQSFQLREGATQEEHDWLNELHRIQQEDIPSCRTPQLITVPGISYQKLGSQRAAMHPCAPIFRNMAGGKPPFDPAEGFYTEIWNARALGKERHPNLYLLISGQFFIAGPYKVRWGGRVWWLLPPAFSQDNRLQHWKTVLEYAADQLLGFRCVGGIYDLDQPLNDLERRQNPLCVHRVTYKDEAQYQDLHRITTRRDKGERSERIRLWKSGEAGSMGWKSNNARSVCSPISAASNVSIISPSNQSVVSVSKDSAKSLGKNLAKGRKKSPYKSRALSVQDQASGNQGRFVNSLRFRRAQQRVNQQQAETLINQQPPQAQAPATYQTLNNQQPPQAQAPATYQTLINQQPPQAQAPATYQVNQGQGESQRQKKLQLGNKKQRKDEQSMVSPTKPQQQQQANIPSPPISPLMREMDKIMEKKRQKQQNDQAMSCDQDQVDQQRLDQQIQQQQDGQGNSGGQGPVGVFAEVYEANQRVPSVISTNFPGYWDDQNPSPVGGDNNNDGGQGSNQQPVQVQILENRQPSRNPSHGQSKNRHSSRGKIATGISSNSHQQYLAQEFASGIEGVDDGQLYPPNSKSLYQQRKQRCFQAQAYHDPNWMCPPAAGEMGVCDADEAGLVDADHILEPTHYGQQELRKAKSLGFLKNQNEDKEVEHNDTAQAELLLEMLDPEPLLSITQQPFRARSPQWGQDTIRRLLGPLFSHFGGASNLEDYMRDMDDRSINSFHEVLQQNIHEDHFLNGGVWMTYRQNRDVHSKGACKHPDQVSKLSRPCYVTEPDPVALQTRFLPDCWNESTEHEEPITLENWVQDYQDEALLDDLELAFDVGQGYQKTLDCQLESCVGQTRIVSHSVVAASNPEKSRLYFVSRGHYVKSNLRGTAVPQTLTVLVRPSNEGAPQDKDSPRDSKVLRLVALYAYDVEYNKYRALVWCGESWKYFHCEQDGEEGEALDDERKAAVIFEFLEFSYLAVYSYFEAADIKPKPLKVPQKMSTSHEDILNSLEVQSRIQLRDDTNAGQVYYNQQDDANAGQVYSNQQDDGAAQVSGQQIALGSALLSSQQNALAQAQPNNVTGNIQQSVHRQQPERTLTRYTNAEELVQRRQYLTLSPFKQPAVVIVKSLDSIDNLDEAYEMTAKLMREAAPKKKDYLKGAIPGSKLQNPHPGEHYHFRQRIKVAQHEWLPKQRDDTDALIGRFSRQGGAILASNVGCMKTAQCCALIQSLTGCNFKRFFIIAPASLYEQWMQHITYWLNELKFTERPKYEVVNSLEEYDEFFRVNRKSPKGHVILLCSPEKFQRQYVKRLVHSNPLLPNTPLKDGFQTTPLPQFIVWDEAHLALPRHNGSARICLMHLLNTQVINTQPPCQLRPLLLLVTATPFNNTAWHLVNLLSLIIPGLTKPVVDEHYFKVMGKSTFQVEGAFVALQRELVLTRQRSDLAKGLTLEEQQKMIPTPHMEYVVFYQPDDEVRQLSLNICQTTKFHIDNSDESDNKLGGQCALSIFTFGRQLASCPHSAILSARGVLNKMSKNWRGDSLLEYKREICEMITDWAEDPFWQRICRRENDHKPGEIFPNKLSKELLLEAVMDLNRDPNRPLPILVFSDYLQTLIWYKDRYEARGKKCALYSGDVKKTEKEDLLRDLATYDLVFITKQAGGAGLEMKESCVCVSLDPSWNPQVELQAAGRVQRPGQTEVTWYFRLVQVKTFDEEVFFKNLHKLWREAACRGEGGGLIGSWDLNKNAVQVSWALRIAYQLAEAGAETEGGLLSKQFMPAIETPAEQIFPQTRVGTLQHAILRNANLLNRNALEGVNQAQTLHTQAYVQVNQEPLEQMEQQIPQHSQDWFDQQSQAQAQTQPPRQLQSPDQSNGSSSRPLAIYSIRILTLNSRALQTTTELRDLVKAPIRHNQASAHKTQMLDKISEIFRANNGGNDLHMQQLLAPRELIDQTFLPN